MATEATRNNQLARREDERAERCRQRQRRRRDDVDGDAEAVEDEDYPDKEDGEEDDRMTGGRTAAEGCSHPRRCRARRGPDSLAVDKGFAGHEEG